MHISNFSSVTKELQGDHTALFNVRALLYVSIEDNNVSSDHLSSSGKIISHKDYENGLVKVQENIENEISETEEEATKELL